MNRKVDGSQLLIKKTLDSMFCSISIYDDTRLKEISETCIRAIDLANKPLSKLLFNTIFELAIKLDCNSFQMHTEEFEPYGYGLFSVAVRM